MFQSGELLFGLDVTSYLASNDVIEDAYKHNAFNVVASDNVAITRRLPDTRDILYVQPHASWLINSNCTN